MAALTAAIKTLAFKFPKHLQFVQPRLFLDENSPTYSNLFNAKSTKTVFSKMNMDMADLDTAFRAIRSKE